MTYFTIYGNFTKLHGDAHMHKLRGNGRPAPQSKESREGFKKRAKLAFWLKLLWSPPKKILGSCVIVLFKSTPLKTWEKLLDKCGSPNITGKMHTKSFYFLLRFSAREMMV